MASDKKEKQQGKPAQLWSRIKAWFRGMKSELKKVVWPTWTQVVNNTVVVIVVSIIFAIVIGLIDTLAYEGIKALLGAIG